MNMSTRKRRLTRSTGVTLELAVLEYLRELAEKEDRDRSFCINQIVREHAGATAGRCRRPPDPRTRRRRPQTSRSDEP